MLKHPRWVVPLEPGEVTEATTALVVTIKEDLRIWIQNRGRENDPLPLTSSLAAVQLGQALQDASAYVGKLEAKRRDADEDRRKR